MQWGTEEQKQKYLIPQAKGEKIGAFGLTEPGAGSDVAAMATTAVRDGDDYVLNGQKTWISLCDVADHFLVFAYTDKAKKHHGISAFIVERTTPGFSSKAIKGKYGIRAGNTGELFFDDMRVPAANLLGQKVKALKLRCQRSTTAVLQLQRARSGLIMGCLEESVKYCHHAKHSASRSANISSSSK